MLTERTAPRSAELSAPASSSASASLELESFEDFDAARETWTPLAERAGNIFSTWEWASTWWEHFGRGRSLLLYCCRRADGSVAGLLPLYLFAAYPLRVVRLVGHGPADQLGPVCSPLDRATMAAAVELLLERSHPRFDLLLAERLAVPERWSAALGTRPIRREVSPTVHTAGLSWESFLAARSANFRQQVRQRERRLQREHDLRFRLADDPDRLPRDLDSLFDLHAARWEELGANAFAEPNGAFHRAFATTALARGWLRLWLAEVAGRPVAAWYGFRYGGCEWYYQAGRDPAWDRTSIGSVLFAHTLREAIGDGVREYKLLLGDEPYKARFATGEPGVETLALAKGAFSKLALRGARGLSRSALCRRVAGGVARRAPKPR